MVHDILSSVEAAQLISQGQALLLAADERVLRELPQGRWIGGTIPYFVTPGQGGLVSRDKVFVTDISDIIERVDIVRYDKVSLSKVYQQAPEHGFSFIIIPAACETHLSFALNATNYAAFGSRPLLGWISGVHLDDLGVATPKVFNGQTGDIIEDGALVLHAFMTKGKTVEVGFINLFEQGDGDVFTFASNGFTITDAFINGEKRNFAEYLVKQKMDTRLPLVANYHGIMVNISFQSVDCSAGEVKLYAPVFTGLRYKHAKPVKDYASAFKTRVAQEFLEGRERIVFSCNCILNYLYSELEGKTTEPFVGPITFGEIAYQLLNQTLVFLDVYDA
jgi:hypothetical protein